MPFGLVSILFALLVGCYVTGPNEISPSDKDAILPNLPRPDNSHLIESAEWHANHGAHANHEARNKPVPGT